MAGERTMGLRYRRSLPWAGARAAAVFVTAVTVACGAGCAKQAAAPLPGSEYGAGEPGFGEDTLASGSSLARARRGLPPEEDGILKDVHFAVDSYDLGSEGRDVLAQNADWLKANPGAHVEVEGHCDDRGTVEYNLALGARRAKAVKDYLSTLGIDDGRMSTISYGEELPVCREATQECWQRNRRTHFVILSQ